ncbi:hypothetical protein ACFL5I_02175, partial [Planctomycetota bacterium]
MKKIKVCFVAPSAWTLFAEDLGYRGKTAFGGSEFQLYQLAKELARDKNIDVSFIVGDFGQKNPLNYKGITIYKAFKPALLNELPSGGFGIARYYIKASGQGLRLWKALTYAQADIYLQSAAGRETGIIAFFCKLFRKEFVYLVASDIDVSGKYIKRNGLRGKTFGWGLKNADLIITQHHAQKELLEKN